MKVVIKSLLYLFGFGENPLESHTKRHAFFESDYDALSSDWHNVGMDIYNAMQKYGKQ